MENGMNKVYAPKRIEKKWQDIWDNEKAFAATNDYSKPKYYALVEFPYCLLYTSPSPRDRG